eukprot:4175444-Amphidinium_carterae.1
MCCSVIRYDCFFNELAAPPLSLWTDTNACAAPNFVGFALNCAPGIGGNEHVRRCAGAAVDCDEGHKT